MENRLWKKGLVFVVITFFIGVSIAPGINANILDNPEDINAGEALKLNDENSTLNSNNSMNLLDTDLNDLNMEIMDFDGYNGGESLLIDNISIENYSEFSINYDQEITIIDDGTADFQLMIDVPISLYADMYREMLGVPLNTSQGEVMEIPKDMVTIEKDNRTII